MAIHRPSGEVFRSIQDDQNLPDDASGISSGGWQAALKVGVGDGVGKGVKVAVGTSVAIWVSVAVATGLVGVPTVETGDGMGVVVALLVLVGNGTAVAVTSVGIITTRVGATGTAVPGTAVQLIKANIKGMVNNSFIRRPPGQRFKQSFDHVGFMNPFCLKATRKT